MLILRVGLIHRPSFPSGDVDIFPIYIYNHIHYMGPVHPPFWYIFFPRLKQIQVETFSLEHIYQKKTKTKPSQVLVIHFCHVPITRTLTLDPSRLH